MAKIIIDIQDDEYTFIKETGVIKMSSDVYIANTIANGIAIPDNATNGDMIKALFPDIEIADSPCLDKVYTGIMFGKYIGVNIDCMRDWWSAPYKRGGIG